MSDRSAVRVVIAVIAPLLLAVVSPATRAALPGGDDPKAFTQHDLLKSRLEFNKQTLAGAYKAVGRHDPKWDDTAVQFLDAMAVYFTYGSAEPIYQTVELPKDEELVRLSKTLADARCADTLVRYCQGVLALDHGDRVAAQSYLLGISWGLKGDRYPPIRVAMGAVRALEVTPPSRKDPGTEKMAWDAALESADDAQGLDLRHKMVFIWSVLNRLTPAKKLEFCDALAKRPTASPWILNYLYGHTHVKLAWEARGTGWASTVTDDGWRALHEHMQKARDYLAKAHALHPEFPEPATEMIAVAMGDGGRLQVDGREWFEKSVRAQLDYYPAYEAYQLSLWPRWGGSRRAMFDVGVECLQTGRYDTYVPFQLFRAVEGIIRDADNDFAILRDPEVQVALWQLLTTMGERAGGNESREIYPSLAAAVKWRAGDFKAAAGVMDKLGERFVPDAFNRLHEWPPLAISEVRAMTGPQALTFERARAAESIGDRAAAIAAYDEAAAKLAPKDLGRGFATFRGKALKYERDFEAGGWVDITPDAELNAWMPAAGEWKREADGAITGVSNERGRGSLLCRADFGNSYELRARLYDVEGKPHATPVLVLNWGDYDRYEAAGISTGKSELLVRHTGPTLVKPIAKVKGGEQVTVRLHDEQMTVLVDGVVVAENLPARGRAAGSWSFVGLGINNLAADSNARFREVQIRRLPEAPAEKKD